MFRCCANHRGGRAIANVFATMGGIYQITDAKKEARLLGVWPLATERDGGLSGSRYPVGAVLKEAAREAAS
jgi:hypothetical protein